LLPRVEGLLLVAFLDEGPQLAVVVAVVDHRVVEMDARQLVARAPRARHVGERQPGHLRRAGRTVGERGMEGGDGFIQDGSA
jgi:hypothetical protein